ncbi:MAG: DMT family transporter [Cryobacterium sp.]|nr:DMT family transporter [Oligoflexia bacterium]
MSLSSVPTSTLGPLSAFFASVTWAVGSATYSKLSRNNRPFDVNFTRAALALPCFLIAALVFNGGWNATVNAFESISSTKLGWLTLSVFASFALGDLFFLWSTLSLGVPGALAVASGYPVLMTLAGVLFEGEALTLASATGVALVVIGIVLIVLNDPKGTPPPGIEAKSHPLLKKKSVGIFCAVFTMFAWALNGYAVSRGGAGIDPFVGNAIRMSTSLIVISILSLSFTRTRATLLPKNILAANAPVILFESFIGSALYVYGLSRSSIVLGGTLSSLAPMLSVPIAVALKLERFSWVRSIAVVIVVAGLSLLFR